MAHLRAFSFTDGSSKVALPSNQRPFSFAPTSVQEQDQFFLHNIEPAIQLIRLRQLQSSTYQKLFKSSCPRINEPWQTMSNALNGMHNWMAQVPNMIRKPVKRLLRSEMLFGSILVLSPPGLVAPLNPYGKALLFSYACEYADIMSSTSGDEEKFVFHASYDILRVSIVARRFVAILRDGTMPFLDGPMPEPPFTVSGSLPPPSLQILNRDQVLNDAISCLERLDKILEHLGVCYDSVDQWKEYKDDSKEVKESLCFRRDTWNRKPR